MRYPRATTPRPTSRLRAVSAAVLVTTSCAAEPTPPQPPPQAAPSPPSDPRAADLAQADAMEREVAPAMAAFAYEVAASRAAAAAALRERWLGIHDTSTLRALHLLVTARAASSSWQEADTQLARILVAAEANHSPPATLALLHDEHAAFAEKRVEYGLAADRLQRALALRTVALGQRHPDARDTRRRRVDLLTRACRLDEAERELRQAEEDERQSGVERPDPVSVLRTRASLERKRGDTARAVQPLERALAMLEPEASQVATQVAVWQELASTRRWQGNAATALDANQRAVALADSRLPADHPERRDAALALGAVLHDAGRLADAQAVYAAHDIPARLRPADTPPAAAPPPGPSCPLPTGSGSIANASSVVASMARGFRGCYNRALQLDNGARGRLRIRASIAAAGTVARVVVESGGAGLPRSAIECMLDVVFPAAFAPPQGGAATVIIPVTFVSR
jgi:tetratricopeptide (TPR) repeat protein